MPLRTALTPTRTVEAYDVGSVSVTVADHDGAQTFLLLHGAGGPFTVSSFADLLAARKHTRVLVPTHPGFAGTERPETLSTVRSLAQLYVDLLDRLDLNDVTVIGSSLGGWVAAEIALLANRRVSGVILVNAVGIEVAGHPITDVSALPPAGLVKLSFHDPSRLPAFGDPGAAAESGADIQALAAYAGQGMSDPTLLERLPKIGVPVVVAWGESDGIVDLDYGRAYADAIPDARFVPIPESGHLPTLETPERLLAALWHFDTD